MEADSLFRGAGGGSSSDSQFVQKPDNLRSNDTFEGLLGLCIGPIKGPVNGLQSIRVNDTPMEDASGSTNFKDFSAVFADGDPLKFPQKATLRLGASGAPSNINLQLRNVGGSAPVWLTHTVDNLDAEAIDLRFVVSALYRQTQSGIFGTTARIEIEMKPSGTTTWINPFASNGNTYPAYTPNGYTTNSGLLRFFRTLFGYNQSNPATGSTNLTITGKTTSPFVKELRVAVPSLDTYAGKSWDIRCRLLENEDLQADPNFEKRTISWESATAVYFTPVGDHEDWRGVAWLQVYGGASDALSSVPQIDGIYDTKVVQVPPATVYDPVARTYTGVTWNGSFSKAYTNDPAWCINDAISDSLSGIARLVPGAHLNKWDALELSKWASEPVPDGAGGTHPRFSMNLAIQEAQRSDEFIRYMAGSCGATAWDAGEGEWRAIVDRPRNPVALFTDENIEGDFHYSHTDVDVRFNDVTVVFLNEEFDYREDRIRIEDPVHIAKYGRKPTKIVAIGCTHRQQALRWAILKMRTSTNEYRAVSFTTNRQGKYVERFDWILVADQSLNMTLEDEKRTTGRIVTNTGGSLVLRDTVRLELGVAYKLRVTAPNPAYDPDTTTAPTDEDWALPTIVLERNITNTALQRGDVRELFIDTPLPADCAVNANVALEAVGLPSVPKVYRVVDINYLDDGERVAINAIEVDTGKFLAADLGDYDYQQPGYEPPSAIVPPPVAPLLGVLELHEVPGDYTTSRVLVASWQRPDYANIRGYRVEHRWNQGPWISGFTAGLTSEIGNPEAGDHEFRIYTVGTDDRESVPLEASITVDTAPQRAPVINLTADDITFDFIDGVAFNAVQVITLTATKQNTDEALIWSVSPAVTLGAPNDNQRTVSLANFGSNLQVMVTVKGATSGATSSVTLLRNDQTTPNDSVIPDSGWIGTVGSGGGGGGTSGTLEPPWRLGGGMTAV